jgi:dTDP-glucose 4,6-dehydratase
MRKTIRWYHGHGEWIEQVTSGAYREWLAANYGSR